MKKILTVVTMLTLMVAGLFAAPQQTVKIGIILPLSGNNANMGQWQMDALKLVKKELETRQTKHKYEFVVEDDQLQGRLTAEALNKLINVDKVAGLMTLFSTAGNVAAPRAQQSKVIHFCVGSDAKIAKGEWNFLHWTPPAQEAELFVKFLQAKGYKRIALLCLRQQGVMAINEELKKQMAAANIELVDETFFNPGERDFRIILARINEKKPDLFVPLAFSPELQIILRQRKQAGLECDVSSLEVFDLLEDAEKKMVEGSYFVSNGAATGDFVQKLNTVGVKEAMTGTPFTYDSINLMIDALEQCPEPNKDRSPALAYLNNIKDRPSAVGNITMGSEGIIQSPAALYQIVGDKSVMVKLEDVK